MQKEKWLPFLISLFYHSLLAFIVCIQYIKFVTLPGTEQQPISSYIYQAATKHIAQTNVKLPAKKALPKAVTHNIERSNQETSTFLRQLHERIQQFQEYPETAQAAGRTGMVRAQFLLATDGRIQNLSILKSSGFYDLDAAALAAINDASPFPYSTLSQPTWLQINIVFQ